MGMQESLTVFGCATAFAAVGAAVVVSVGLLFAPCGLAVFKVVEGVTTVTVAGRAAMLIVSAAGAGVGAQIGNAVSTRCFIVRKIEGGSEAGSRGSEGGSLGFEGSYAGSE